MPPVARCAARLQGQRGVLRVEPRNSHSGGGPHGTVLTRRRDNTSAQAKWQSGHATVCNAVDVGSTPTFASKESAEVQREPDPVSAVEVCVLARGGEPAREE